MNKNWRDKQLEYWNARAKDHVSTHPDPFQNQLELEFMLKHVQGRVLNGGCGPGFETRECSDSTGFAVGIDISEKMIQVASQWANESTFFRIGDVLDLKPIRDEFGQFDTITTRRTLINLNGWIEQRKAIEEFRDCLTPNGRLILIEGTEEGYAELNTLRRAMELPEIVVRDFNRSLPLKKFERYMTDGWNLVTEDFMGVYYFLTRVFYPLFEEPKYGSSFAEKAYKTQMNIGSLGLKSPVIMSVYEPLSRHEYESRGEFL